MQGNRSSDGSRVNDGDAFVALEVVEVKGEDLAHLVNCHCCHETSVMDANPRDSMLEYEFAPGRKNLCRLGKKSKKRLKSIHVASRLLGREAQAIGICRSR